MNYRITSLPHHFITVVISSILLLFYTAFRAYHLSFTFDESYSFLTFVNNNFLFPKEYNCISANNHLLNTWFMKICSLTFGNSELSLRLPNIIAHAFFLYFSYKIISLKIDSSVNFVAAFLIVNLNPYVLDFFSVARGYGMSLSFMMGSIYFLLRYFQNPVFKYALFSLLIGAFAVLAHFTMLNYFVALNIVLVVKCFFYNFNNQNQTFDKRRFLKFLLIQSFISLVLLLSITPILLKLNAAGSFALQSWGESKGFWEDTVGSLIENTLYQKSYKDLVKPIVEMFVVLILCLSCLYILFKFKTQRRVGFLLPLIGLLLICICMSEAQNIFLGTKFLKDRSGLFLIPIFILLTVFLLDSFPFLLKRSLLLIFSVMMLLHFSVSANFHKTMEYQLDADAKSFSMAMENYYLQHLVPKKNISLGTENIFHHTFNFYRVTKKLSWLDSVQDEGLLNKQHDFYFISEETLKKLKRDSTEIIQVSSDKYLLVNRRKNRNTELIYSKKMNFDTADSKANPMLTDELASSEKYSSKTNNDFPYSAAFTYIVPDSLLLRNKNLLVKVKAMAYTKDIKANAQLVISFEKNGSSYSWQSHDFYYLLKPNTWTPIYFSCLAPKETKVGDKISAYLWNLGKIDVLVDDMEFTISKYPF